MKKMEYFKVVLILPFNVIVTIPLLIFLFTQSSFSYDLVGVEQPFFYISIFFLGIGLWLSSWSVKTFYIKGGDGTPGPWNPVTNLVVAGPYRYVRNPMILGVLFLLLFESAFFTSLPFFFWFLIFFVLNFIYFKNVEEKELVKRFGYDYEEYQKSVSMFLPKLSSYDKNE